MTRRHQESRGAAKGIANRTDSHQKFNNLVESTRGQWIIARALHLAIQHIDSLPPRMQATSDQRDMRLILTHGYPTLAQLFQHLDSQVRVDTDRLVRVRVGS